MQHVLTNAKKELATYIGPQAMLPILQPPVFLQQHAGNAASAVMQHNMMPMMGIPTAAVPASHGAQMVMREPGPQQQARIFEAQQQLAAAVAAREQQEMFRGYEHQQGQQQEIVRFNGGGFEGGGSVTATGFNQISPGPGSSMSSSLALGSFDNSYQIQTPQHQQQPIQAQLLLQTQQGQPQEQAQQNQQQLSGSEDGRSLGPSSC
ncbi:hypothetical protein V6N11_058457 [Hibiscus sabdariffa]|uniref:Uncharacterized protein n=1 Tax=Hibiscus sabdariffa TaxID=183260 RepID=A0ABR2U4L5_9ROSI